MFTTQLGLGLGWVRLVSVHRTQVVASFVSEENLEVENGRVKYIHERWQVLRTHLPESLDKFTLQH